MKIWDKHLPVTLRSDMVTQKLEFYMNIHFAIMPFRPEVLQQCNGDARKAASLAARAMQAFRKYLETRGQVRMWYFDRDGQLRDSPDCWLIWHCKCHPCSYFPFCTVAGTLLPQELAQSGEFLSFYALPYVPSPSDHPSFKVHRILKGGLYVLGVTTGEGLYIHNDISMGLIINEHCR
jgi:hypothetical protein